MKGFKTSYVGLLGALPTSAPEFDRIEIPLIQRDFAQGRAGTAVAEIRENFLDTLIDAIAGGDQVSLDFIYGSVDDDTATFRPLDGQQRLTTLFLIHWYLASLADRLDSTAPWTRFSYATRASARLFCERLVVKPLPLGELSPRAWITDQPWYLHVWHNDPTIQSMLVMIEAIHERVSTRQPPLDPATAWARLTTDESPAVSFYLLPLDDMGSDEELYIKMNSRGKPLTPFENFKAKFEQDIRGTSRAAEFSLKIDGTWSDLFWPYHGGDDIVDDEFIRYFDYLTEICELRDDPRVASGRLGARARDTFGEDNPLRDEHLDFLFAAFDTWGGAPQVEEAFAATISLATPGESGYDSQKVVLFAGPSTNLFERCVHQFDSQQSGRTRNFSLQQSLYLYAVLLHRIHETPDFTQRLRTLRNLVAASEDEVRRGEMPGLLADVTQVIVNGDLDAVSKLNTNQINDERLKQNFLADHPEAQDSLRRLEDHPLLRGSLHAFELDADTFASRASAFEKAFADPSHFESLTGALLATGDYQRPRPRSSAWQFGSSSANQAGVWRYLLTNGGRTSIAPTREVLGEFLDGLADSGVDVDVAEHCDRVMSIFVDMRAARQHFDWRYHLVKQPSMRSGDSGIYFGIGGELGYSMCMLRKTQLNSNYWDPILLEIYNRSADVADDLQYPLFTGYDTHPRWLRLEESRAGLRSVEAGFELATPVDASKVERFLDVCRPHGDVLNSDDRWLLAVPQAHSIDGAVVDTIDRVEVGARLLRALVEAGF